MQPPTVALIALLAPLPATAFGNLDCISYESCGNGGCGPETQPFAIDFDWATDTAIVTQDEDTKILKWTSTTQTDDGLASVLEYGDLDTTDHFLRIEANGQDITALFTVTDVSTVTWIGTCNVRQAA